MGIEVQGNRRRGRPNKRRMDCAKNDLREMMICRVSPPRGFPVGEEVIGHLVPIGSGQWRAGRAGPWAVWRP